MTTESNEPFLRRVQIRNYKSIAKCDLQLGRFNLFVGRNGSGKSNFLDALRFIADGLQTSLDHAMKSRGGVDGVRRKSTGHPHNIALLTEVNLPNGSVAEYGFEIGAQPKRGFSVKREQLRILSSGGEVLDGFLVVDASLQQGGNGRVQPNANLLFPQAPHASMPPVSPDRLYLVAAAGLPQFRPVYDGLIAMGFYSLSPEQMKEVQSPDAGEILRHDGSNIASVVARLSEDRKELKDRICQYLQHIVPDITDFERVSLSHRETLEFRQQVKGSDHPWRFYAASMSDGTLRTLGVLVATMQLADRTNPIRLVGIEEPETALHPAAAEGLMDALREAAGNTQVLVTTHSPDLLDQFDPDTDRLFAVVAERGLTEIGPVDEASLEVMRQHLYTAGQLLRMDQLEPDPKRLQSQRELVFPEFNTKP